MHRSGATPLRVERKRVDGITSTDVTALLAPIWTTRPGTARQARQRIGAVLKWAVAEGYRYDNHDGDVVVAPLPCAKVCPTHRQVLPFGMDP